MKRPVCIIFLLAGCTALRAETGYDAWLRYEPIREPSVRALYERLPATVVALGSSPVLGAAQGEIVRGMRGMLGRTLRKADARLRMRRFRPQCRTEILRPAGRSEELRCALAM